MPATRSEHRHGGRELNLQIGAPPPVRVPSGHPFLQGERVQIRRRVAAGFAPDPIALLPDCKNFAVAKPRSIFASTFNPQLWDVSACEQIVRHLRLFTA